MASAPRLICASAALVNSGRGTRFELDYHGETAPGFVVRYGGRVYGYLNRCRHFSMELDWLEGEFFADDGCNLICSTHGATYDCASGRCVSGPCEGASLVRLRVEERDGSVFYLGVDDE